MFHILLCISSLLSNQNRWSTWCYSMKPLEFLFIFFASCRGNCDKGRCEIRSGASSLAPFRLKSIKECLFIHRFCDKIFNSTKTEKRLIKMVACKRNVLSLPLLFTCLWLEMFSCTWWNTGNISANYKPPSDTDLRDADLLMCFLHINHGWTLKDIYSVV